MSGAPKPRLAVWRDALCEDGDLTRDATLLGLVLSSYMNGDGVAWPGRTALARGCKVSVKTVERRTRELERAGFIRVERSSGGRGITNRYEARLPETASGRRRSEWETATRLTPFEGENGDPEEPKRRQRRPERASGLTPESGKKAKAESDARADAQARGRAHAHARPEDDCMRCGHRRPLNDVDGSLLCDECASASADS